MALPAFTSSVRRGWRTDFGDVALTSGLLAIAFIGGYVLLRAASLVGPPSPVVVLAIPLLPLGAFAILNDARFGVVAIFATFPIGTIKIPVLPIQLIELTVVGVAVIIGFRRLTSGQSPLPVTRPTMVAMAFCLWQLVSFPSSLDRHLATRDMLLFAIGVVAITVVVAACESYRDIRVLLTAFLAVAVATCASSLGHIGDLHAAYGASLVVGRATGVIGDPNQFGSFAGAAALVALGLALGARSPRSRVLYGAASVACVLALLLSFSRGAWVGFTLGFIVLVVKLPMARRLLVVGGIPMLLIAVLLGSFAPSSPQVEIVGARLKSITGERNPYDSRPALWSEAVREISVKPVTGFGPGSFPEASSRATSKSRTVFGDHAHNWLLTWAAENGVPAASIAIIFGITLHVRLKRVAKVVDRQDRAVVAGVAAALTAAAGQGLVDYTLRHAVIAITLFLLIGCGLAFDHVSAQPGRQLR